MLKQVKRSLQVCIVLAIILTTMPLHMFIHTQAASVENRIDSISFIEEVGYYAQGGNVYKYDKTTKRTIPINLPMNDVESVVYDGTNLYVIGSDMRIYAYDFSKEEPFLWSNETYVDEENEYKVGSSLYLDQGVLYINAYSSEETKLFQLQVSDGKLLKESSKGAYRYVDNSLPYKSDDKVVFSGKDIAFVNQSSERFVKLYENFTTSVYDATSKQIFALDNTGMLYTSILDDSKSYITLYKTKQSFVGKQSKATIVENTPVVITIENEHVILYFYNGVNFEKQDTNLITTAIENIAFVDKKIYLVDAENSVQFANYTLPLKQQIDAQAAQLQKDILIFYDSISQNTRNLTLEKKAEITALSTRFQVLSSIQKEQVMASVILEDLCTTIQALQKNVDDINAIIDMFASPEEFKKEDRQKAIYLQEKYNALKTYDKTLINQKFLSILDKIEAFRVEDEIAALPSYVDISETDLARVQEIMQHYHNLVETWKKDVSNYPTLQRLENRIYEIMSNNTLGDAYWSNFGGNNTSSATTNTKTPYLVEDVQSNFKLAGNFQSSIIVDNHIYSIRDKTFLTILDIKGNVIAETKLYNKIGFFSRIAYGDGKVYVALSDRIQAFDAKTLRPLWMSQTGNQFISTITYHNGYIYSGMTNGGSGGTGKTNGYFFGIDVSDEDADNAYEVKDFAWTCGEAENTGYYWAGAAIVGDAVIFAGDSGEVISHHLTQDIVYDRYLLGDTKVRANVSYIEEEKAILVGTQDSKTLFKIKVNENGSFQKDTISKVEAGGEITGGIAYYKGRAYVPSGGMYASGFSVVDITNMKLAYVNKEVGTQSYPLISTAYATESNNEEVKVYVLDYKTGNLLVMSDEQGQTTAEMEVLAKGYGTYNSGSVTPDEYGNLYICGASFIGGGPLYSIQSKEAKFQVKDVENAIANFPTNFTYKDKKPLRILLETYLSLSESDQEQVKNANLLLAYEQKMQILSTEKLNFIQNTIDSLLEPVSIQDQELIERAMKEYGELLESDQLRITNYKKLSLANDALQLLLNGYEQLRKDIDSIDLSTLRLEDQVTINTLMARYAKLSEQERQYITNFDKLQQALKKLRQLSDMLEIPSINEQVRIISQINTLSLANEKQVLSLYKSMMFIDEEIRSQIVGYENFLVAYQDMIEQRKQVDEVNDAIWNDIQPLNIQLRDRSNILAIYERYTQIPQQNKAYVNYVEDLQYAKMVIDKMENGYLAQALFEKIKQANTSYSFETTTSNGMLLKFTFEGKNITNPCDFAFSMKENSTDEGAIYSLDKNAKVLAFAQEGSFPGKTSIQMQTDLMDGTYYLYYYNPISKKAEFIQDIEVIKTMISFELTHASTYFISKEVIDPLKNAQFLTTTDVQTGDTTIILYLWIMGCMSLATIVLLTKKNLKKSKQ